MNPQDFVRKWSIAAGNEKKLYQQHFLDLCELVEHPKPAELDPSGTWYAFEAGVTKASGGQGFADVWKKGFFAWEYKGHHADLDKAYAQLLQYKDWLYNPPLLVVSDIYTIRIHTNFTNTPRRVVELSLNDLLAPAGLRQLRAVFRSPDDFRTEKTTEQVTVEAAELFGRLAALLHDRGHAPERVAHFLIRVLFCLFAEDIELLPQKLFSRIVDNGRLKPGVFNQQLRMLFGAMAEGGFFGVDIIRHFDGGLFDSADAVDLDHEALRILHGVTALDWSAIEPSIIGTLFERSLDPSKRAQLGAHYTSRDDILLIVEPVLMAPLRRRWDDVRGQAEAELQRRDEQIAAWQQRTDRTADARRSQIQRIQNQSDASVRAVLGGMLDEVRRIRVLDPACGSGNFLYISLRQLMDLEKEIITFAAAAGVTGELPQVDPVQLYGIELNEYAHELAQATVWIGWIQWLHENGYGRPSEPILKPLDNIRHMDAILAYDEDGAPVEPHWPEADVIVGNPPFLGGSKLRRELGDRYVEDLWSLYSGRVPGTADLVCYWFERAREQIYFGRVKRAGLLATQSISSDTNRGILERILETGGIFWAWSNRPWVLEGAAVRVAMVGFDNGDEQHFTLDGTHVKGISTRLTAGVDIAEASILSENANLAFVGSQKIGPFDISENLAQQFLTATGNPNGRPNSDVVKRSVNGADIMHRWKKRWIIDFGANMTLEQAAQYELPFEYVKKHVYPIRQQNNRAIYAQRWWIHGEARPGMRAAIQGLSRFIVTSRVSRYRVFVWLEAQALPDNKLCVIAKDDDYSLGVLQSRIHLVWAEYTSAKHGVGNDQAYNVRTTFETFPFPWQPGSEPAGDPRVHAIAAAAADLVQKRDAWLNPPDATEAQLKKRTLTNLYNERPTWLHLAHQRLDEAVAAAYGWPADLEDEEILARLLALNLERAEAGEE